MTQKHSVGIDLGTTYSSLAYVDDDGHLASLRLSHGGYTLASAIYFKSSDEVIVGDDALHYSMIAPDRVARKFKRDIGKDKPPFTCDGKSYRPQELSAMVLKRLLQEAEPELGPITRATISVPFVFDDSRRQATMDAAHIAGLEEVDIVDEPVAAGIAYGNKLFAGGGRWNSKELDELFGDETILVYDLGGGTFDATVMRIGSDAKFEVRATTGDWELGGEDWDDILLNRLCDDYEQETGESVRGNVEHMQELRLLATEAKRTLSERAQTDVDVNLGSKPVRITLTRGEFERESLFLLTRTTDSITEMFERQELSWSHIDRILLVGGSSRMPMVHKHIGRITEREFDMSLSPDTAIAHGAALFAAFHAGNRNVAVRDVSTVNSHALGLAVRDPKTGDEVNDVLLPANEPTLKEVVRSYAVTDPKKGVLLIVLLGDSSPDACVRLGQVRIGELPKGKRKPRVQVSYCFQENGMLAVEGAMVVKGGKPTRVRTEILVEGKMNEEEIAEATQTLRGIDFA